MSAGSDLVLPSHRRKPVMNRSSPYGRAQSLSAAEFNAKAKRVAESTGIIEKGAVRRPAGRRWNRPAQGHDQASPDERTSGED
ncbi:hypothetical protein AOPFMNJM_3851 [Methylobacterium jeotgali]|uniref:Stress-induced protein n=2 Tax=Methylobacteriaceae TaxID=119045 RepID=A0ABQ4T087_9HYPH|nr:hypothetical protein AOPFMNJM_3851 [Methylobacterium jeotgali]